MLAAPFPYYGGKRSVVEDVWTRFGSPSAYVESFCGSAAILLGAPRRVPLETINDASGFIVNFWRAVKDNPHVVANWADYPLSELDLNARHEWLMSQCGRLKEELEKDPAWPGDAKVAGWWLWGQCAWMGPGWCDWWDQSDVPHRSPHISNLGRGIFAQEAFVKHYEVGDIPVLTSAGQAAWGWLAILSKRLERVRILYGDWKASLNCGYGGEDTAVFLDPPYIGYEDVYSKDYKPSIAVEVQQWCKENEKLKIALCGHAGDYKALGDGWREVNWARRSNTGGGANPPAKEAIWFSPACIVPVDERSTNFMDLL
jgi:hypothetical protein